MTGKWLKALSYSALITFGLSLPVDRLSAQEIVKFGSVGGMTDAGIYLADELGFFSSAGIKVEMQRIPNAPSLTAAIATNQLDAAGISVSPGLYASVQQGMNLKIVGDKQSLRQGFSATQLVIRSELNAGSEAADIAALKGKKVAVSAKPSISYMLLVALLEKHGLKRDFVQTVELAYPNMVPALASGAIDAAIMLEPFLSQAVARKAGVVVSDLSDVVPGRGISVVPLVYSENFIKRRAVAQNFMNAYVQGVRVYNDAFSLGKNINQDKVVQIIARRTNTDESSVREQNKGGLDPDQTVGIEELEAFQKFFIEQNFLHQSIDVKSIVDLSFSQAAVAKFGPYK